MSTDFSESNPPAFPLPLGTSDCAEPSQSGGLSMRDYFAAAAMAAYVALEPNKHGLNATMAYAQAEAMLKARTE